MTTFVKTRIIKSLERTFLASWQNDPAQKFPDVILVVPNGWASSDLSSLSNEVIEIGSVSTHPVLIPVVIYLGRGDKEDSISLSFATAGVIQGLGRLRISLLLNLTPNRITPFPEILGEMVSYGIFELQEYLLNKVGAQKLPGPQQGTGPCRPA